MKQQLKKLRPLLLCLFFPLLLADCALEESISLTPNSNEVRARIISYKELEGIPMAMEKLNSISVKKNKRLAYSSKYNFTVDTERVLLVEKGGYRSLSFPVYRDTVKDSMENLFLHPHNGGYLAFLASYAFTPNDMANLDEGKLSDLGDVLLKMSMVPLDDPGLDLGVPYQASAAGGGYSQITQIINGDCYVFDSVETIDGVQYLNWIKCAGCCPDASTGSGSPGPSSGISHAEYYALVDVSGSGLYTGPSGGNGSGGNSGSGGNNPGYTAFNPVKPEDQDPLLYEEPGFYHPNPIIGVVSPNRPTNHEKNCEELKKMTEARANNGNQIRNSLVTLQGKVNEPREYGYYYSDDQSNPVALSLVPGSDNMLDVPTGGGIWGASHTHPNPSITEFTEMFSTPDIFKLGEIAFNYVTPEGQQYKNYSKFVLTLTVKGGQEGNLTFALKIDNWQQFRQFVLSYNAMTDGERITEDYLLNNKYLETGKQAGTESYLKDLFKYIHEKGYKGFSVYKAGPNLDDWAKQEYNPDTNIITPKPCN